MSIASELNCTTKVLMISQCTNLVRFFIAGTVDVFDAVRLVVEEGLSGFKFEASDQLCQFFCQMIQFRSSCLRVFGSGLVLVCSDCCF